MGLDMFIMMGLFCFGYLNAKLRSFWAIGPSLRHHGGLRNRNLAKNKKKVYYLGQI